MIKKAAKAMVIGLVLIPMVLFAGCSKRCGSPCETPCGLERMKCEEPCK